MTSTHYTPGRRERQPMSMRSTRPGSTDRRPGSRTGSTPTTPPGCAACSPCRVAAYEPLLLWGGPDDAAIRRTFTTMQQMIRGERIVSRFRRAWLVRSAAGTCPSVTGTFVEVMMLRSVVTTPWQLRLVLLGHHRIEVKHFSVLVAQSSLSSGLDLVSAPRDTSIGVEGICGPLLPRATFVCDGGVTRNASISHNESDSALLDQRSD